ncbi:hypothetical protein KR074_011022 [Drosophila pseudoananassae]|nr:hypothetical protein KR074_011022 [Drosophila pseudoananassae]
MSFTKNLHTILEKLNLSDNDRRAYTDDAVEIQNCVVEKLKSADATFCQIFDGLSLFGNYLDRVKLVTPDEFDLLMKLKLPFPITPVKCGDGFVSLKGNIRSCLFAGPDGVVRRNILQKWLRSVFKKVFSKPLHFRAISGQVYTVNSSTTASLPGCAHNIEAVSAGRTISFDMVPAFEFSWAQWPFDETPVSPEIREYWPWFAIPQKMPKSKSKLSFMICAPHWEREVIRNSHNFRNVLRLMKGLRDGSADGMPHLSSYMLKAVMLHRLTNVDWKRDLGLLLLEMWCHLSDHLRCGRLEFFLASRHNILSHLKSGDVNKCRDTALALMVKLKNAQDSASYTDLANCFKIYPIMDI